MLDLIPHLILVEFFVPNFSILLSASLGADFTVKTICHVILKYTTILPLLFKSFKFCIFPYLVLLWNYLKGKMYNRLFSLLGRHRFRKWKLHSSSERTQHTPKGCNSLLPLHFFFCAPPPFSQSPTLWWVFLHQWPHQLIIKLTCYFPSPLR